MKKTTQKQLAVKTSELNNSVHQHFNSIILNDTCIEEVSNRLRLENENYCRKMDVIKQNNSHLSFKDRHYMATTIGGLKKNTGCLGGCYETISPTEKNKILVDELVTKLGGLNISPSAIGCKNIVGRCAEVRVADNLLNNDIAINDFKKIEFTTATRPRTQEQYLNRSSQTQRIGNEIEYFILRCSNCIEVFGMNYLLKSK